MNRTLQSYLKKGSSFVTYLIEDVSLSAYLLVFMLVVVGHGVAYSCLTPISHGMGKDSKPLEDSSVPQGLYFSVVTVSSLGYGDIHPMGFSKVLVCGEVLFGLAFMGVVVAKITSRRLSYHVQRLFSSDAQKRLEEFAGQFEATTQDLQQAMANLGRAYQRTPGENAATVEVQSAARAQLSSSLASLHSRGISLQEYLAYECEQGRYFAAIPAATPTILRIGNNLEQGLFVLGQIIICLPNEVRADVLDFLSRQRISDLVDAHRTISRIVQDHASNEEVKRCFRRLQETCEGVFEQYFAAPMNAAAIGPPDQQLHGADEPEVPR